VERQCACVPVVSQLRFVCEELWVACCRDSLPCVFVEDAALGGFVNGLWMTPPGAWTIMRLWAVN
jgi:hypothetical protein